MRCRSCLLLPLLLFCALPLRAEEVQVPFDSAGTVLTLDATLARRLGLFQDQPGFQEARLFEYPDTTYRLEIGFVREGQLRRERQTFSQDEVDSLRTLVTRRLRETAPPPPLDQSGRVRLVVGMSALSLGFYGWAVPVAGKIDGSGGFFSYLLISATGTLMPILLTRESSISEGTARTALYGGTRGIVWGYHLNQVFTDGEGEGEGELASAVGGSLLGVVAGYQLGARNGYSPGRAAAVGMYGDGGLITGLAIGETVDDSEDEDDRHPRTPALFSLAGTAAGLYTGHYLTGLQSYSVGDAYLVREVAILTGLALPLTIIDVADLDDADGGWPNMMIAAGTAGGMYLAHQMTRNVDFTPSQGALIGLSELGGALVGAGIAHLMVNGGSDNETDSDSDSEVYATLGTVGAAAGLYLGYRAFHRDAPVPPMRVSWDLDLAPEGALGLAMGSRLGLKPETPLPLARLRVTF